MLIPTDTYHHHQLQQILHDYPDITPTTTYPEFKAILNIQDDSTQPTFDTRAFYMDIMKYLQYQNSHKGPNMSNTSETFKEYQLVYDKNYKKITYITYCNANKTYDTSHRTYVKPEELTSQIIINGFIFEATYINKTNSIKYISDIPGHTSGILPNITFRNDIFTALPNLVVKITQKRQVIIDKGQHIQPTVTILEEQEVHINKDGTNLHEKYVSIVGNISEINSSMNMETAAKDTKELFEAFKSAEASIKDLTANKVIETTTGAVGSFVNKYIWANPVGKKFEQHKQEQKSVQETINYLFGLVDTKYTKLIQTGESLQASKSQLNAQIEALEAISKDSSAEVSSYSSQADVPMRMLALDTNIKSSIEKYRGRLLKIDGAIIATQTTIIALGKDLPALKTDLTDEMAIGTLLNSVDDYQKMYTEIATLVADVTKATAEQTHKTIENLLQMQIDDTHTMTYIAESGKRAEKFATMIADKTQKVATKTQRDATFIADIVKGNTLEHARATIKKIGV